MNQLLTLILRVFLGGVFVYAGLVKSAPSAEFAVALAPFTFLPPAAIPWIATSLPILEILLGIAVIIPPASRTAAAALLVLLLAFMGLLTWALANGLIVACGCFGPDTQPSAVKMVAAILRDAVLAGVAAVLVFWPPTK